MKDIEIKKLFRETEKYADSLVTVRGWVRTNRGSNKFGFIELNDGTFFKPVQVVYEAENLDNFTEISKAPISAALKVTGRFVMTPYAKQPWMRISLYSRSTIFLANKKHKKLSRKRTAFILWISQIKAG